MYTAGAQDALPLLPLRRRLPHGIRQMEKQDDGLPDSRNKERLRNFATPSSRLPGIFPKNRDLNLAPPFCQIHAVRSPKPRNLLLTFACPEVT